MIHDRRARQADEILQKLLELPRPERAERLARSCGDDAVLKNLVARLLDKATADDTRLRPGGGLEMLGVETSDFAPRPEARFSPGDAVGVYRLSHVIGRGGMATVYLATRQDGQFEQTVALKILDRGGETLARFEQERQILASLDHPNIARLLDGGVTDGGVPYVAMEYIDGLPLLEYCNQDRLGIEDRLRLFINIVSAVHDAHRSLIVHRDIKSANILVTAKGIPKLLDFGIAKLLDVDALPHAAPLTRMDTPMTPEYASPEQVRGEPMSVATDIYQLGYLLYVLLTDQSPYAPIPADMVALIDAITRHDPAAPSQRIADTSDTGNPQGVTPWAMRRCTRAQLEKRLRGDLDRVALKALHKDPEQRYGSAAELATDIRNVLAQRPIIAMPDSMGYRAKKFIRRHTLAVAASAAVLLAIVIGSSLFTLNLSRAKQAAELEAEKSTQVTNFLMGLFEANDPAAALGDSISARELLDRGAAQAESLESQPEVQAQMFDVLGQMYRKLGQYDEARPLLNRALIIRRERFGSNHLDVAQSLTNVGLLKLEDADYTEAEDTFEESLAIQRAILGEQHPDVAANMHELGYSLGNQSRYAAAELLHREALAIQRAHFGVEHAEVAAGLNNLGLLLWKKGNYDEAEMILRESLVMHRRIFGDVHPNLVFPLNNLALVLFRTGDTDGAEELFRERMELNRALLGDEHTEVAHDLNNLAVLLSSKGKHEEAESMHRQALALRKKLLPEEHPDIAQSLHNIATELRDRDPDEALALYREALSMRRAALGTDHSAVASTLQNLAILLADKGDYKAAVDTHREALRIRRKVLGSDHADTGRSLNSLANSLRDSGDAAAAESLHREAISVLGSALGATNWRTASARSNLGASLTALGRYEEAERLLLGALEIIQSTDRAAPKQTANRYLAELYDAWGREDEAARYREPTQTGN